MNNKLTSLQKDELMDKLKQELIVANFQELVSSMTEKCFKKCVLKPNTSLDSGEQKCINYCVERFIESRNLISRSYVGILQNKASLE